MIDSAYVNKENNDKHILIDRDNISVNNYVIVDKITENRPDLIALILHSNMSDIDIFCNFNGIIDVMNIPKDSIIRVPDIDEYKANTQYFDILPTNIDDTNDTNNVSDKKIVTVSPNMKTSIRKNYTSLDNGVFIF